MKLKIFEPAENPQQEPILKLLQEDNGDVAVIVVDKNGRRVGNGHLVTFRTNGTVYMHRDINGSFGFQLDSQSRLIQE